MFSRAVIVLLKMALAACLAGLWISPAHADWYEAQSDHFVIYADDREKDIRRFTEQLERYHSAMEFVTGRQLEKPSPSNRVTIFVVGNGRDIRKLVGNRKSNIAGFYRPRAGGSVAFVQDIRFKRGYPDFSTIVLLHEYAHHFLISSSRFAMPRWLSEGAAEFFAAASFPKEGGIEIGKPALHRAGELFYADEVSIYELFDDELYRKNRGKKYDAYYGRSWLLYHYLILGQQRPGQFTEYWQAVGGGKSSTAAAKDAFGDLDVLEDELDDYLKSRSMFHLSLGPDMISTGDVKIRPLSEGEAEVMPLVIQSKRGVNEEQAAELVVEVREIANAFPQDAAVLSALAEAEFDSGNHDAAIAAADSAIAIDPSQKNAYLQKGYALFAKAEDADDMAAAYRAAMKPFSQLNKLEPDHPLPLLYYYRSYSDRGAAPPENARHALERASQLAPFDHDLALNSALMLAGEGKIALANSILMPVAANPHGGGRADYAQQVIYNMKNAVEGEPYYPNFIPISPIDIGPVEATD